MFQTCLFDTNVSDSRIWQTELAKLSIFIHRLLGLGLLQPCGALEGADNVLLGRLGSASHRLRASDQNAK